MSLTILFDATPYSSSHMTGAGRYVINVLRALGKIDLTNRYRIFGFEPLIPHMETWPSHFAYTHLALPSYLGGLGREWARRNHVRREVQTREVDVVQCNLDPVPIPGHRVKMICMLYDVMRASSTFFKETRPSLRFNLRTWLRYTLAKKADRLLTISDFSKNEIVSVLGVPAEKITVTALAADERYTPGEPDLSRLEALGIRPPYALFVGEFGRQKNEEGLIRSFLAAFEAGDLQEEGALVLVGDRVRLPSDVKRVLRDHPPGNRIVFPGPVDDETLLSLYRGARLFALPSFIEGFGLPVLEAMACGTPVIVSDVSSLPEVVGDAGMVVPPDTTEAIRHAIVTLWNDPQERDRLSRLGLHRAGQFSFSDVAEKTLSVYQQLCVPGF